MTNRIQWLFEDENNNAAENTPSEQVSFNNTTAPVAVLPWQLFSALTIGERTQMQRVYQEAYERTQAQEEQRRNDAARFERLLEGFGSVGLDEY